MRAATSPLVCQPSASPMNSIRSSIADFTLANARGSSPSFWISNTTLFGRSRNGRPASSAPTAIRRRANARSYPPIGPS